MVSKLIRLTILSFIGVFCLCAQGEHDVISTVDLVTLRKQPINSITVSVESASLYEKANQSTPVWVAYWTESYTVDLSRLKRAPSGWIPIKGSEGKIVSKQGVLSDSWIRRRDVVLESDYKKVIDCWPIKRALFTLGDYAIELFFNINGSASAKEYHDDPEHNHSPYKAHVYMAGNLIKVQSSSFGFYGGYRETSKILYSGHPAEEQELFTASELKECSSILLSKH